MKFQQRRFKRAYVINCYSSCAYANNRRTLLKLYLCNKLVLIWLIRLILERNIVSTETNTQLWILDSNLVVFKVMFFCILDWILNFPIFKKYLGTTLCTVSFFSHLLPWNYWELKLFFFFRACNYKLQLDNIMI